VRRFTEGSEQPAPVAEAEEFRVRYTPFHYIMQPRRRERLSVIYVIWFRVTLVHSGTIDGAAGRCGWVPLLAFAASTVTASQTLFAFNIVLPSCTSSMHSQPKAQSFSALAETKAMALVESTTLGRHT